MMKNIFKIISRKISGKKEILSTGIINLNSSIKIPKRRELSEAELKNLKSYKSAYERALKEAEKRNITLLSPDIESTELQDGLEIYINLLLDLFDEKNNLRNTTDTTRALKLNFYLSDITNLKTEALLRLKALREVYRTNIFIQQRNKETLLNEIRILENDYLMLKSQEEHAKREIETYKIEHSIDASKPRSEESLTPKLNELYKLASIVSQSEAERINNSKISTEIKIAFFEKLLEMYVYKNKEKLSELEEEFDKLNEFEVTSQNRENLLEDVKRIEQFYKIFYYFGKELVSDAELYNLYELKLNLLYFDMPTNWQEEIKNCGDLGIKYYVDILERKLENIVMGYNENLEAEFGKENMDRVITCIKDYLKFFCESHKSLDFKEIIQNALAVVFLLKCEKENGLLEYFDLPYISSFENGLLSEHLEYALLEEENMHPKWRIHLFVEKYENGSLSKKKYPIPELMDLAYLKLEEEEVQYVPEGIVEIVSHSKDKQREEYINKCVKDKTIILPKTLKSFDGNIFKSAGDIILNEGLELLTEAEIKKDELILPSTLTYIYNSSFEGDTVILNEGLIQLTDVDITAELLTIPSSLFGVSDTSITTDILVFNDYKNSELINGTEKIRKLQGSRDDYDRIRRGIIYFDTIDELFTRLLKRYFTEEEVIKANGYDGHFLMHTGGEDLSLDKVINLKEIWFQDYSLKEPIIITRDDMKKITVEFQWDALYDSNLSFNWKSERNMRLFDKILKLVEEKRKSLEKVKSLK